MRIYKLTADGSVKRLRSNWDIAGAQIRSANDNRKKQPMRTTDGLSPAMLFALQVVAGIVGVPEK